MNKDDLVFILILSSPFILKGIIDCCNCKGDLK